MNSSKPTDKMRLQRFLSDAGVASRRKAEELVREGRVLVNNEVVDTLPAFVDPDADRVVVNGTRVRPQRHEYFIVHKPKGVVCTNRDPSGRTRAVDLLPELKARLFAVGRLDVDSTGLLLMTNDGELAERLTHPRYGVPKTYRAEVKGRVETDLPEKLKAGVFLSEGRAKASDVEIAHTAYDRSVLMITLREGRNRQVRRMLARVGHRVRTLKRVQFGPLTLKRLPVGAARRLSPKEVAALREAAARAEERTSRRRGTRGKPPRPKSGDGGAGQRGRRPEPPEPPRRRIIS